MTKPSPTVQSRGDDASRTQYASENIAKKESEKEGAESTVRLRNTRFPTR